MTRILKGVYKVMSFYNSLKQLWIKIEQKNIVLVSGNVDETIPAESKYLQELVDINGVNKNEFINLIKFIELKSNEIENKKFISVFSPNKGNIINGELQVNEDDSNDEFSDFGDKQAPLSLTEYLSWMNSEINATKDNKNSSETKLFVINFADIFMNNRGQDLNGTQFAQILDSLLTQSQITAQKLNRTGTKLIIISREPNLLNTFITNNTEFSSVSILKPNKDEREEFFTKYNGRFQNLKETISDIEHPDFREAISTSNGLTFREIFQLSKLKTDSFGEKEFTFAELYKIATFFKKESEWEKIDPKKMSQLEEILKKRVKGQDVAIQKVKNTLIRSFVGMNGILHSVENSKPKGILFFAGPTGTGKTELSKSIAEFIFGDENRIIRFDMSEYNHEHSDQRLIGAPPGYVGYDAGGELTNKVKENPFSVLLFDEIEKAHGKILDKFLQILEDGRLTSSQGEIIDFSQTFIIFTSNIGASTVNGELGDDEIERHFIKEVTNHFCNVLQRPEILNRISEKNIVPFHFITDFSIIKEIILSKVSKMKDNLKKEKNIWLSYDENFIEKLSKIVQKKFNKSNGGRGILNELENILVDRLSVFIFDNYSKLQEAKKNNKLLKIDLSISNNEVNFELE